VRVRLGGQRLEQPLELTYGGRGQPEPRGQRLERFP
jgi:hypothetical protein